MEKMIRKLGRIGQVYQQINHLMLYMHASMAYALHQNDQYLASTSKSFRDMIKRAKKKPSALGKIWILILLYIKQHK